MLDLTTGEAVTRVPKISWMRLSVFDQRALWFDGSRVWLGDQDGRRELALEPRPPKGVIDAAFGPGSFCLSEAGGAFRYFRKESAAELAHVPSGTGWQWTRLSYSDVDAVFSVIQRNWERPSNTLYRFDPLSGRMIEVCELESFDHVFCKKGALLLGSDGDLRRTSDGSVIHRFDWPAN